MAADELLKLLLLQKILSDDSDDKKETKKNPILDVGLRVVRGPDWRWDYQDGGEGHVGTVVEIAKPGSCLEKTVVVQWDCGDRHTYRIGQYGGYDLRTLENATLGIQHSSVTCNSCRKSGIYGFRWKCRQCYDFDMCSQCYMAGKHDITHTFVRRMSDSSPWVNIPKRQGAVKVQMRGIFPSAKVARSTDWEWGSQDGGPGKTGIVTEVCGASDERSEERNACYVQWSVTETKNLYRVGLGGKMDVKYMEDAADGFYYREHLPVLGDELREVKAEVSQNTTPKEVNNRRESVSSISKEKDDKDRSEVKETGSSRGLDVLSKNMKDLFFSDQFCDLTVKVKNRKFHTHKAILCARSSILASKLQNANEGISTLEITDCDPSTFEDVLFYLYTGKMKRLTYANVTALYDAAVKYDVQSLKDECARFHKNGYSADNICDYLAVA